MSTKPRSDLDDFQPAENVFEFEPAQKRKPVGEVKQKKLAVPRRPRADETFVRLPYRHIIQSYGKLSAAALFVLVELDHQHFKAHGDNPVRLSNQTDLAAAGMPRCTKARALRELQKVGLIRYTQAGCGAFMVALTWHPVLTTG
jgi:hypothetical protein